MDQNWDAPIRRIVAPQENSMQRLGLVTGWSTPGASAMKACKDRNRAQRFQRRDARALQRRRRE
ncbi:hypothetical protein GQ55_9G017200 [Panicum hallii var. hallii]|uniref:Uncharacterized protein n=1 Tax=Panicum hallii var. hallii TaxID=1504633 RepID=A0A2T7BYJ4_9POAL|nr:hypothetical protein GQ55_9G017200 [Panicum hallii var. hallii]